MSSSKSKKWVCVRNVMLALCASLVILFACSPAFSQGGLGTIQGTISAAGGGPLGGATVSVVDVGRGEVRPLTTSGAGLYAAAGLTPGAYTVRVEAKGFKTMEHTGITLTVGATLSVDFTMQAGAETEIVTITAEVLPANANANVDNKTISETPVNGRNFVALVENRNSGQTTNPGGASNNRTSNGMRTDQNNPLIDGIYDGDIDTGWQNVNGFGFQGGIDPDILMPLDAIGEISSNGFPTASYGWHLGNVTNIGIKSGTNALHGTAYAYGRDADLDTRNPQRAPCNAQTTVQFACNTLAGPGKPPFALQQWGGSLGGKIKKDKLFYFANFERFTFNVGQSQTINPPTDLSLSGGNVANINPSNSIPDALYGLLTNTKNCSNNGGVTVGVLCTGTNYVSPPSQVMMNMLGCGNLVLTGINAPAAAVATNPGFYGGGLGVYPGGASGHYMPLTAAQAAAGGAALLNQLTANCGAPQLPSQASCNGNALGNCFSVFGNNTNSTQYAFGKLDTGGPAVGLAKMDYHLNKQHSFNGEFYYGLAYALSERSGDSSPQAWWVIDSKIQMDIARAVWVWTPNSSVVNEARFGMDWVHELATASDCAGVGGAPSYINLWGFNSGANPCEMPLTTISKLSSLSFSPGAGPYISQPRNFIGIDSVAWTRGRHVIKFGAEIRRGLFTGSGGGGTGPPIRGTLSYGSGGIVAFSGASSLQDVLTGANANSTVFFGPGTTSQVRANYYAGFLQDTIRLNRKTTVDLGVRYEFQPAYYQPQNQESVMVQPFGTATPGPVSLLGQEIGGQALYHQDTWKHNFSPRYAIAYDLRGNGKTIIRAAGGIMYAMTTYSGFSGMQNNPTGATFFAPTNNPGGPIPCNNVYTTPGTQTLDNGLCGFTNPYCNSTVVVANPGGTGNVNCINQGTVSSQSFLGYNVCNAGLPNGFNCSQPQTVFGNLLGLGVAGLRCGDGLPTGSSPTSAIVGVVNPAPCSVSTINPNLYIPYVTNWTVSLQQSVGKNITLNLQYVGNHGTAIRQQLDLNQPAPGIANATTCSSQGVTANNIYCKNDTQARTPFTTNCASGVVPAPAGTQYALFAGSTTGPCAPFLSQVLMVANSDVSNYDAFLASVGLRGYHGLTANLNYSLQHCMDIFSGNENIWTLLQNDHNPRQDYSTCANGTPNRITANWNWIIPGRKSFAQILQGWAVNSTMTLLPQKYQAFTDGTDSLSGVGSASDRWSIFGAPGNLYGYAGLSQSLGSLLPCYAWTGSTFATGSTNGCSIAPNTQTISATINSVNYTVPNLGPSGICTTDALALGSNNAVVPGTGPGAGTNVVSSASSATIFPLGLGGVAGVNAPLNSAVYNLSQFGCYVFKGTVMLPGAQGTFGDMSKNCCLAPGFFQIDLSVTKTWGFLKEQRLKMQFRAEIFNILNHTNYTGPGGALGTPNSVGGETASLNNGSQVATGTGGERQVQMGLKFIW